MTFPSETSPPAPIRQFFPIFAPCSTIAAMPVREPSPTSQPWTMARCPTVTPAPIVAGKPGSAVVAFVEKATRQVSLNRLPGSSKCGRSCLENSSVNRVHTMKYIYIYINTASCVVGRHDCVAGCKILAATRPAYCFRPGRARTGLSCDSLSQAGRAWLALRPRPRQPLPALHRNSGRTVIWPRPPPVQGNSSCRHGLKPARRKLAKCNICDDA